MTFIDNNNPWADDGKRAVAVDKVRAAVNGASANGIGAAKFGSVPPAATELTEEPSAWPILAPEALRGLPGEIVEAATRNSEADPVAVLVTLLAASGCACGRNPYILAGDAFHNARLFAVLVGQSSRGRKGTSEKPIKRLFENCKDAHGYMRWSNGPASTGEGMVYAIRDGDGKEDGDPGIEDKRLFIVEGEFAAVLTVMKRQGNTLSAHLRAFWDGETIEPLTKTNPIKTSRPHVSIVGHITKTELDQELDRTSVFNGFANRFLWLCVRRSKMMPLARGMSKATVEGLGNELGSRLAAASQLQAIDFSNDARDLYESVYAEMTADIPGRAGVVTARAEAQVIRLALVYALIDASPIITAEHLESALAVLDYANASARLIFGKVPDNPVEGRVLTILASGPKSTTELHRLLSNHVPGADLHAALDTLIGRGRIDRVDQPTAGRSITTWQLRPGF